MSRAMHTYYNDDDGLCIIRDIYDREPPACARCGLREVCKHDLAATIVERVMAKIDKQIERREFWEEYGEELYEDIGEV